MANSNSYMKEYMLRRYHKRMNEARLKLGNKCFKCDCTENLQLDHIDPKSKNFTVAKLWNSKPEIFEAEVSKCQLLCAKCHEEKTLLDMGRLSGKNTHGTLSSYRYCKCELCRKANAEYVKMKRAKKKLKIALDKDSKKE
jgi:hypothetical protein